MHPVPLLDCAGRRRSPATLSSFHQGRSPRNKGLRRTRTTLPLRPRAARPHCGIAHHRAGAKPRQELKRWRPGALRRDEEPFIGPRWPVARDLKGRRSLSCFPPARHARVRRRRSGCPAPGPDRSSTGVVLGCRRCSPTLWFSRSRRVVGSAGDAVASRARGPGRVPSAGRAEPILVQLPSVRILLSVPCKRTAGTSERRLP